jgi:hypothetical protein
MSNEAERVGEIVGRKSLVYPAIWAFAILTFPREMLRWFIFQWFALYLLTFTINTVPAWEPGATEVLRYWETWKPTLLTWPAAALWLYCVYRFFAASNDARRRRRAGEVVRSDVVEWVSERVAPSPPPAPVPVAVVQQQAPEPADDQPRLIIPTSPNRRVRRGGETLSGVPVRDRRVVDPRSL